MPHNPAPANARFNTDEKFGRQRVAPFDRTNNFSSWPSSAKVSKWRRSSGIRASARATVRTPGAFFDFLMTALPPSARQTGAGSQTTSPRRASRSRISVSSATSAGALSSAGALKRPLAAS
jgi:hypothetical protein